MSTKDNISLTDNREKFYTNYFKLSANKILKIFLTLLDKYTSG